MKQIHSPSPRSEKEWQWLGQVKMPVGPYAREVIDSWLAKLLEPYQLPLDLLNKLKESIYEVVSRVKVATRSRMEFIVYISSDQRANSNWGFFKMEKLGVGLDENFPADPIIEYYFYLEK